MHEPGGRRPQSEMSAKPDADADGLPPRAAGSPPEADPPATDPEDSPYRKLPWPLVAGVLAAVLLLALGAGIFANRYLRQPTVVLPPPTQAPLATSASTVAVAAPATPTRPPIAAQTTPEPRATVATPSVSSVVATEQPSTVFTVTPVATPTVDPGLAAEVVRAYEAYWQARAQALLELDTTRLGDVAAGEGLIVLERGVQMLRSQQRALRTRVLHSYRVVEATEVAAEVADQYVDESVFVNPVTREPLDAGTPTPAERTVRELYKLEKRDGSWKVVDGFKVP
jgi:hypothetical protein